MREAKQDFLQLTWLMLLFGKVPLPEYLTFNFLQSQGIVPIVSISHPQTHLVSLARNKYPSHIVSGVIQIE